MSTGEADLEILLRSLNPALDPELYVFGALQGDAIASLAQAQPLATFVEDEGLSVIMTTAAAKVIGLAEAPVFRRITLQVHSSLEAVGLTAAVSTCLAEAGLSANVVAAFHHDHIFIPAARAEEALNIIRALSSDRA